MTVSPPATKYECRSIFDDDKHKNRGKSFGLSRDKLPNNSYFIPQLYKIPGPGQVLIVKYLVWKSKVNKNEHKFYNETKNFGYDRKQPYL